MESSENNKIRFFNEVAEACWNTEWFDFGLQNAPCTQTWPQNCTANLSICLSMWTQKDSLATEVFSGRRQVVGSLWIWLHWRWVNPPPPPAGVR